MNLGFRKYGITKPQEPTGPQKSPTACMVNGCPMPGVYRLSNDESICCCHDGIKASDWASVTTKVRRRWPLWEFCLELQNSESGTAVTDDLVARVTALGGRPFAANEAPRSTQRKYAAQLRSTLLRECRGEGPHLTIVPPPTDDSWSSVGEVV